MSRRRKPPAGKKKRIAKPADIPPDSRLGRQLLSRNRHALSIIITAYNEESTIRQTLALAMQLRPKEIIVIENGSTDGTTEICKAYRHPVRCFFYPHRLGRDIGRALGAKAAEGEVLLFLDGDLPMRPASLLPFVKTCYDGAHVALNDLNPFVASASTIDYVTMAKYYLNCLLSRRDLGICSLTAVPHAMTKRAALAIGWENLAVPPKAHAMAVFQGMKVSRAATVNVFRANKLRPDHNEVGKMILGDHIEAIHWLQACTSARVNITDAHRRRAYAHTRICETVGNVQKFQ